MIDRAKIESDIAAADQRYHSLSREIAQQACIDHAADLLAENAVQAAELDRITTIIGREVFNPGIVAITEWTHHGGPDPHEGVDYLAVGRAWLERQAAMEQGKRKWTEENTDASEPEKGRG